MTFGLKRAGLLLLLGTMGMVSPACANQSDDLLASLSPDGYVSDKAKLLSPQQNQTLSVGLAQLQKETGIEIAVVTLPEMKGGEINDFANRLFEKWSIGNKGKDNGLLFLVAVQERKARIEVGYGLEPIIPDARAGRVLREAVFPSFKAGDMAGGIVNGTAQLVALARQDPSAFSQASSTDGEAPGFNWLPIIILVIVGFSFFRSWRNKTGGYTQPYNRPGSYGGTYWGGGRGGFGGGGGGSGGFGGFGGGSSGGGGASGGW